MAGAIYQKSRSEPLVYGLQKAVFTLSTRNKRETTGVFTQQTGTKLPGAFCIKLVFFANGEPDEPHNDLCDRRQVRSGSRHIMADYI